MKKLIYIFCITFLVLGCTSENDSSEEETQQVNPNDLDGDGVTNQQEVVDNTDPDNPCDFRHSSQYYPSISNTWKALDCDGDGVSNWKELDPDGDNIVQNNITNTLNGCSLNLEDVDLEPSEEWLLSNCDDDPFSNGQEIQDATDIFDSCDFLLGNQDLQISDLWRDLDCDDDSRNNGREIDDGTNPLDPSDFDGAGSILKEIYSGTKNDYYEKHTFIDGILYDKIEKFDGTILADFEYDDENRLTSLLVDGYTYTYSYENNQISQIVKTQGSEAYTINIEYDGNIIYTYDGNELPGLFTQKFTFNNQNQLIEREEFSSNGTSNILETYQYDDSFENLLSSTKERRDYDIDTDEFYEAEYGYLSGSRQYEYLENNIINPFYQAYQNIRMNIILSPKYNLVGLKRINYRTFFFSMGCLSTNFLSNYDVYDSYDTGQTGHNYGFGVDYVQTNNYPSMIYTADYNHISYEVHYE